MKIGVIFTLLLCALTANSQVSKIESPSTELGKTSRALPFPPALGTPGHWTYWLNDHFVDFVQRPEGPRRTSVSVYDHDGRLEKQVVVWSPEAREIMLRDAVITADGTILVAGSLVTEADKLKRFIAEPADDGTFRRVIWTDRYQALAICPMEDSSIWVYGSKPWDSADQPFSVLRHYWFDKGLQGEAMPSSLLTKRLMGSLPRSNYFLTGDKGRLHGLDIDAGVSFELDLATSKVTTLTIPKFDGVFQGAALLTSGEAFANYISRHDPAHDVAVFQLVKQAGNAVWIPVSGAASMADKDNFRGWIIGSDGDELVFRKPTDHGTEAQWAKPQATALASK